VQELWQIKALTNLARGRSFSDSYPNRFPLDFDLPSISARTSREPSKALLTPIPQFFPKFFWLITKEAKGQKYFTILKMFGLFGS